MKELTMKQISELLSVQPKTIRQMDTRGVLEKRLLEHGYKLHEKKKVGRSNVYIISVIQNVESMTIEELCGYHRIKKVDKFSKHTINRASQLTGSTELRTKLSFANSVDENIYQIDKYDNVLVVEQFMKKDGFIYLAYKDGKCRECEREEYITFWKNNSSVKRMINSLGDALMNKRITLDEYNLDYSIIIDELSRAGEIYHKVRAYKKDEMFDMILTKVY